jgi:hypothetical protein
VSVVLDLSQCKTSLGASFIGATTYIENQLIVTVEFHGDKTLLTSHETLAFPLSPPRQSM